MQVAATPPVKQLSEEEKEARAEELVRRVLGKFKNAPTPMTPTGPNAQLKMASSVNRNQRRASRDLRSAAVWQSKVMPELATALDLEGDRQERPHPLTAGSWLVETVDKAALRHKLLPNSTCRTAIDLYTLALVLYTAITLPVTLLVLPAEVEMGAALEAFEIVIDISFILDIALNFNTCYISNDIELVTDRRLSARHAKPRCAPFARRLCDDSAHPAKTPRTRMSRSLAQLLVYLVLTRSRWLHPDLDHRPAREQRHSLGRSAGRAGSQDSKGAQAATPRPHL